MWAQIAAANAELLLFIGDNNYGDQMWGGDAGLSTLRAAYAQQAETPELTDFRSKIPMMITWDDHDFGINDGGASFAYLRWSKTLFETFWSSSEEVKSRAGIYESRIFGEEGKRMQVIMLDTRFFRSDLDRMAYTPERPPLGPYVPSTPRASPIPNGLPILSRRRISDYSRSIGPRGPLPCRYAEIRARRGLHERSDGDL